MGAGSPSMTANFTKGKKPLPSLRHQPRPGIWRLLWDPRGYPQGGPPCSVTALDPKEAMRLKEEVTGPLDSLNAFVHEENRWRASRTPPGIREDGPPPSEADSHLCGLCPPGTFLHCAPRVPETFSPNYLGWFITLPVALSLPPPLPQILNGSLCLSLSRDSFWVT